MLIKIYDKIIELAGHRHAEKYLALDTNNNIVLTSLKG